MASLRVPMADVVIVRECRHGQVRILYGDITSVEGDIMVIPANSRLAGREGLDEVMQQAAGNGLREHCAGIARKRRVLNLQPCGVGEAISTPAFDLPASNLVHVVGPDCRRPTQDNFRRELLRNSYAALFAEVEKLDPREILVMPPLSMDVYAYPHREGARMTMELVLSWMDGGEDPGVRMVHIVTHEDNFLNNMKTIYREGEDQMPGVDRTRDYRKGKIQ